jgi:hypothetical protein
MPAAFAICHTFFLAPAGGRPHNRLAPPAPTGPAVGPAAGPLHSRGRMRFPIGAMSLGDILDRGLKLLFARFPLVFSISLLVQLPFLVFQLLVPALEQIGVGLVMLTVVAALVSAVILGPIAQAIILYVVMQEYVDRPTTLGRAFNYALSRFGPLLGSVILAGLIIGVGFLLCVLPGIYFAIVYAFVAQVVVLENRSGMDALNRSKALVAGHWWRVFGVIFLIQFVTACVGGLVGAVLATVLPYQEIIPGAGPLPVVHTANYVNYAVNILVQTLIAILMGAYLGVCQTLLYLDLRIRKEGFDLEMEAQKETLPPQ